ncbi:hypothetical protein BKN14_03555 [Candidatus Gracilibacteria bacterium HOT-871]|nr:hypothetical protein BKN14_03555 [Candidatus Gracilibacteria bacterium HOT-871]
MKKERFEGIMFSVKMMNITLILGIITAITALWYFGGDTFFEHLLNEFKFHSKISKDYLWIIGSFYLILLFVYYFVLVHFLGKTFKTINNGTILDAENKNLINILFILYLLFPIISYGIISIASILFTWILYEIIKFGMIKKVEKDKLEEESKLTI